MPSTDGDRAPGSSLSVHCTTGSLGTKQENKVLHLKFRTIFIMTQLFCKPLDEWGGRSRKSRALVKTNVFLLFSYLVYTGDLSSSEAQKLRLGGLLAFFAGNGVGRKAHTTHPSPSPTAPEDHFSSPSREKQHQPATGLPLH